MKSFSAIIFGCFSLAISCIGIKHLEDINITKQCFAESSDDYLKNEETDEGESLNRGPFNGTATNITLGSYNYSTFNYPRHFQYYRFNCTERQFISLNYVGPSASLRIFYSSHFSDSDYLVSVSYVGNSIDCYYFDKNCEYIIELGCYGIGSPTGYYFHLEEITLSTMTTHTKFALHQIFDSTSTIGYHYETVFFNVNTTSYLSTSSYTNSYSSSTDYDDVLDNTHYFISPNYNDSRRVVEDTGFDEYSAVAYAHKHFTIHPVGETPTSWTAHFSGTFISETTVITCAHSIYSDKKDNTGEIATTSLNKTIYFQPGINTYSSENHYGEYKVTELYVSISYLLQFNADNRYSFDCADYDWCVCLTTKTTNGTRTHSYMGISGFSYNENLMDEWPYARNAGYPSLVNTGADDLDLYQKAMWASYPLQNNVYISGNKIMSNDIVISRGNSGGPLYSKTLSIQNGHLTAIVHLLGIASGFKADWHIFVFYRNTALIVNIVDAILNG